MGWRRAQKRAAPACHQFLSIFGGNTVRVRGPAKVMCHLMFGVLVLTIAQVMRRVT